MASKIDFSSFGRLGFGVTSKPKNSGKVKKNSFFLINNVCEIEILNSVLFLISSITCNCRGVYKNPLGISMD